MGRVVKLHGAPLGPLVTFDPAGRRSSISIEPKPKRMKHSYLLSVLSTGLFASVATAQMPTTMHGVANRAAYQAKLVPAMHHAQEGALRGGIPNDDCAGATVLTVGSTCTTTDGNLEFATESQPAATCSGFSSPAANDAWYTFTATGNTTVIEATGGGDATTGMDVVIEVFAGSCSDLGSLGCVDASVRAETEAFAFATVTGSTYFYRVYYYEYTAGQSDNTFTTCVYSPTNIPANDLCSGATNQPLSVGNSVGFTGDNTGGLDTELLGFGTVWHSFTTTECTNLVLSYCGTTPAFGNAFLNLFSDCPPVTAFGSSSFNTTDCPDGNVTIYYQNVPAGTYYYGVLTSDVSVGPYTITVAASACAAPAPNDDCANAIPLTAGSFCNYQTFGSNLTTESLPAILCNGFTGNASDDIWFSFVATATGMTVGAQGTDDGDGNPNTGYDAVTEVFDACGGTSLGCADATLGNEAEAIELTGLTIGNTYYMRVYHYAAAAATPQSVGVCVVEGTGINIGIAESADGAGWSVYPNPNDGQFSLVCSGGDLQGTIEISDVTGRVVHIERIVVINGTSQTIQPAGLSAGTYSICLSSTAGRSVRRVVIK